MTRSNPPIRKIVGVLGVILAMQLPAPCAAQSLQGSRESVLRMYHKAVQEGLHFFETVRGVKRAAANEQLVRLKPNSNYTIGRVRYPYVQPTTRIFVERLGAQYKDYCGERLVITSAIRPESRQPRNSVAESVHPTGIAVDLRRPRGECLGWLRETLLDLEDEGLIEATEEHWPAHFHVAVFPSAYKRYVARLETSTKTSSIATP
jgi:hypothetical protein